MTPDEFAEYEAKAARRHGRPVLDALIDNDPHAVAAGMEIQALHVPIIRDLRARGWRYDYTNPSAPTGATLGLPDFKVWAARGRFFVVECKTRNGKLSKAQTAFKRDIEALGHRYHVVKSLDGWRRVANNESAP